MFFANEFSVGLYAPAFPRDPLNVNVYLEHVVVGQAIELLFTLGDDGLIKGAVAEKWLFNNKYDELTVSLRVLNFSNGKPLSSEDVVFSLERHMKNSASQSYNYIEVIKKIIKVDTKTIKIILQNSYSPILLLLSRDHLGILPNGWKFDSNSKEPYIGSGPYRIIKEKNVWRLIANDHYRNPKEIKITNWRLDIIDASKNIFPQRVSDLFLQTSKPNRTKLVSLYKKIETTRHEVKSFSFMQSSFWWINEKYSSHSAEERKQIRAALDILSELMSESMGGGAFYWDNS